MSVRHLNDRLKDGEKQIELLTAAVKHRDKEIEDLTDRSKKLKSESSDTVSVLVNVLNKDRLSVHKWGEHCISIYIGYFLMPTLSLGRVTRFQAWNELVEGGHIQELTPVKLLNNKMRQQRDSLAS